MPIDPLDDFERTSFTHGGNTKPVYRKGDGPGVVVISEIPGITPEVADFARRLVDDGFSVAMPRLFGVPGKPMTVPYAVSSMVRACVSKEFVCLATRRTSPVTEWLRALARDLHARAGGPGVGAIGMCLTGGFALAMMLDEAVIAPVLSQPSLPFPVTKKHRRDLGLGDDDLRAVKERADQLGEGCLLGVRFSADVASPTARFERLAQELGPAFVGVEIDSSKGNPHGIPRSAHSVVTEDLVDEPGHPTHDALQQVIDHFRTRLDPRIPVSDWFDLLVRSSEQPGIECRGVPLPAFPPDDLQLSTTGNVARNNLIEAREFYEVSDAAFRAAGNRLDERSRLLDFGCGWGRITRLFLRDLTAEQMVGIDVDSDFVDVCRDLFDGVRFETCGPFPPSPLESGTITHAVGYSVFSHLSEDAAQAWIEEFHRLLRPGGVLMLTTRGRGFLDFIAGIEVDDDTPHHDRAVVEGFGDVEALRRRYDAGEFVYVPLGGGGPRSADFYGEALIPESYVRDRWGEWFTVAGWEPMPHFPQDVMTLVRRG